MASVGMTVIADDSDRKTLIPRIPDKWNSPILMLGKLGLIGWFATQLGNITGISGAIWALVLGVFFTTIGFLETNLLNRANSYQIIMFALMMYVFDRTQGLHSGYAQIHNSSYGGADRHRRFRYGDILVCDRQDPEDVFPSCFRQRTDGSLRLPLRRNNHRVHMQRSGRNRRRKTVPDEQDVPVDDSRRIHHCNYHIRVHRRMVPKLVIKYL